MATSYYYDIGGLAPPASNGTLGNIGNSNIPIFTGNSFDGTAQQSYYWTPQTGIVGIGFLPGGTIGVSTANDSSADGRTIVGYSFNGTTYEAYHWTPQGGMIGLGNVIDYISSANFVSDDGSVVFGQWSAGIGHTEPFVWTTSGGRINLGSLGGSYTAINAITPDGRVAVGQGSHGFFGVTTDAFRWTQGTGMVTLGNLGGGYTAALDVSNDGNIIVGRAYNGVSTRPFRWTQTSGIVDLGTLGGQSGIARAISGDGSTIVGYANNGVFDEAFRWTQGTGMIGLGTLGGNYSEALKVSSNGSVIIGNSDNGVTNEGFVWDQAGGMRSLRSLLTAAGVDITGWGSILANGISNDGNIVSGSAVLTTNKSFLISLVGPISVITGAELTNTLTTTAFPIQQSSSLFSDNISQSILVARNALSTYFPKNDPPLIDTHQIFDDSTAVSPAAIAPAAGDSILDTQLTTAGQKKIRSALYTTGTIGIGQKNDYRNSSLNGSIGVLFELSPDSVLGAGITNSYDNQETRLGGHSKIETEGISILGTQEFSSGLRLYGSAVAAHLRVRNKRNYINANFVDTSYGATAGYGIGMAARIGYEFCQIKSNTIMPYAETQWSYSHLNSYREAGGAFPATIDDQSGNIIISRIGSEWTYNYSPETSFRMRGAWGHRLTGDGSVNVTAAGVSQTITSNHGDRDWLEAGLGLNHAINKDITLSTDLTGRSSKTSDPAISATVGFIWKLN